MVKEAIQKEMDKVQTEVSGTVENINLTALLVKQDARPSLEPLVRRVATLVLKDQAPALIRQEILTREEEKITEQRQIRDWLEDGEKEDMMTPMAIQTTAQANTKPKVSTKPPLYPPPRAATPVAPENNPSEPSDRGSSSGSDSDTSSTTTKSLRSRRSSTTSTQSAPVGQSSRKNLTERPIDADENDLKTFRDLAEAVERKDGLSSFKPALRAFTKAVDYKTYRLINRSASYTPKMTGNILKAKKKVDASMSGKSWNGKDKIGVLNFLTNFKKACDDGGLGMMLFQYYVKESAWNKIKDKIEAPHATPEGRADQRRAKKLTSWSLIVQRLLRKHADNQDIAEANSRVTAWRIPDDMSERKYADVLQDRARKCGDVYSDDMLLEYFANGVDSSIQ